MENFGEGLLYAGMGILVVFAVLVILMLVIMLMQLFAKNETDTAASAPAVSVPVSAPAIDTNETIAVISAAVAAMSGDDPNKRLRVRSITDQAGTVIWRTKK